MMIITAALLLLSPPMDAGWQLSTDTLSEPLATVTDMVVTGDGTVFVLDHRSHQIFKLDKDGEEVLVFGRRGNGPGELVRAGKLDFLPKEQLLAVTDQSRMILTLFDTNGQYVKQVPFDGQIILEGLFFDLNSLAYVKTDNAATKPDQGSRVVLTDWDVNEEKVLARFNANKHQDPHLGKTAGGTAYFVFPWDKMTLLAKSPDSRYLFFTSSVNLDVQVFDRTTSEVIGRIQDDLPREPLTPEDIDNDPTTLRLNGQTFNAASFSHDEFKTAIAAIGVDSANRLWVKPHVAWNAKTVGYRVYDLKGKKLGVVSLPAKFEWVHANEHAVWGYVEKEEEFILKKQGYSLKP